MTKGAVPTIQSEQSHEPSLEGLALPRAKIVDSPEEFYREGNDCFLSLDGALFQGEWSKVRSLLVNLTGRSPLEIEESPQIDRLNLRQRALLAGWCTQEGFVASVTYARNILISKVLMSTIPLPTGARPESLSPFCSGAGKGLSGAILQPSNLLLEVPDSLEGIIDLNRLVHEGSGLFHLPSYLGVTGEDSETIQKWIDKSVKSSGSCWTRHTGWTEKSWSTAGKLAQSVFESGVLVRNLSAKESLSLLAHPVAKHFASLQEGDAVKLFGSSTEEYAPFVPGANNAIRRSYSNGQIFLLSVDGTKPPSLVFEAELRIKLVPSEGPEGTSRAQNVKVRYEIPAKDPHFADIVQSIRESQGEGEVPLPVLEKPLKK